MKDNTNIIRELELPMKTFLVKSYTNYGEVVHVVNADNETEARTVADGRDDVWEGYEVEELSRDLRGVVAVAGGDGG